MIIRASTRRVSELSVPRRPPFDYGPLITSLKNAIDEKGLQPVPIFIKKNIELYEMICVRRARGEIREL